MRMNLQEIRKGIIRQYLLDIDRKDEIFKALSQEVTQRIDDDYITMRSVDPNFSQEEHKVIIRFLYELADSVDSRLDHNRDYKLAVKGDE
jgi:hypothetical protein